MRVGSISSTFNQTELISGIAFYAKENKRLTIGYQSEDSTDVFALISFSKANSEALPYIKNTASGTLFAGLSGGGIKVQNGLIKDWDISGAWSGSFNVSTTGGSYKLTYSQGLLTSVTIV